MKEALTYDDISIIPKHSNILHRDDVSTITEVTKNIYLEIPLISSPMDTITGYHMAQEMAVLGGMGIVHRFMSIRSQCGIIKRLIEHTVGAAIGVTGDYIERAQELVNNGCKIILIDVAHGHHLLVKDAMRRIKNEIKGDYDIIAGSIATGVAARDLCEWGVDAIRVGIGSGSLCSTRIQTGVGIPMVTALFDTVSACDTYNIPVIADGGIRVPGDVAKAIACGANAVMLGSLLSGTKETPGAIIKNGLWPNEKLYKKYRGSASIESKLDRGEVVKNVEGYSKNVPYKGKTKRIIDDIVCGLKSSMSYINGLNIEDYQSKADFVKITNAGIIESKPHLIA